MRTKRPAVPAPAQPVHNSQPSTALCWAWEAVFSCQRHPVYRSQLITALMAGTALNAEAVPVGALPDALLLCTAARAHCEAEVVDDYPALVRRMEETFKRPDFTARLCDTAFLSKVSGICWGWGEEFINAEDQCVPLLVRWLLEQDAVPEYFKEEL
jgi:hypothetical protein